MNDVNFTQLASDGKQYSANPLSERFNRVPPTTYIPQAPARTLSTLYRALQGISAVTEILAANGVQVDLVDGQPLNPATAYSLLMAAQALADYAIEDIEGIADWADKRVASEVADHA